MAESADKQTVLERVGGLSDELLESVDAGRQAAVAAVHKFANTLEEATSQEGDPSRRKTLIEAAVNLADELSAAQMKLLHSITRSTTSAIGRDAGLSDRNWWPGPSFAAANGCDDCLGQSRLSADKVLDGGC